MIKNHQAPTPPEYGPTLQVHSIFPTIQGEGPFAGKRAVFIRLAHCNLQCPGCDTEYTEGARSMWTMDITNTVIGHGPNHDLVVITGGEPFRQDIRGLCASLQRYAYRVQIETNGVLFPWDIPGATIVVSPKTHHVHKDLQYRADAYKYVVKAGDIDLMDGLPIHALDHKVNTKVARPPEGYEGTVYVQPMDEYDALCNDANMAAAVRSVKYHGHTLCLQMHKYAGLE